jgi:outer membrane protein assembly factor BamE (lipoprotein component of BamABCDE complex)
MNLSDSFRFCLVNIVFVLLAACSGIVKVESVEQLKVGMTQSQVLDLLGKPARQYITQTKDGRTENWVYDGLTGGWHNVLFRGDNVMEIQISK